MSRPISSRREPCRVSRIFRCPTTSPDYPDHRQLLDYIRSFADEFDLRRNIRFGVAVDKAVLTADGLWELQFDNGDVRLCRYLVCANGVTWVPNLVSWPGEFNGVIRHAVSYRSPKEFEGKRVLVVGAGNSGADIACDASFSADQAFLSVRRGYHFIPKHIFGMPSDVFASQGPSLAALVGGPGFWCDVANSQRRPAPFWAPQT